MDWHRLKRTVIYLTRDAKGLTKVIRMAQRVSSLDAVGLC
jgi:hypothetical protein